MLKVFDPQVWLRSLKSVIIQIGIDYQHEKIIKSMGKLVTFITNINNYYVVFIKHLRLFSPLISILSLHLVGF